MASHSTAARKTDGRSRKVVKDGADEFIRTYNTICDYLVRQTGLDRATSFSKLVDKASLSDATMRRFQSDLKDFGRLRNAIVHHAGYPQEIIAEPKSEAIASFQTLVESILSPKQVIPAFKKTVREFTPTELLKVAVAYMRSNDFSQVVVRDGAALRLVTTEGIAGWLASRLDSGPVILESAVLSDALEHEMPDNFEVVDATCTIYEVRERFATYIDRGKLRLDAILITESGTDGEAPIGFATPWDLLRTAL